MARHHYRGAGLVDGRRRRHAARSGGAPAPWEPSDAQPDGYDIHFFYGDSLVNGITVSSGATFQRGGGDVDAARAHAAIGVDGTRAANGSQSLGAIVSDTTPVYGESALDGDRLTLAEFVGRAYLDETPANRRSLVVVAGRAGWVLDGADETSLRHGGAKYLSAVTLFNTALANAKAAFPGSRVRSVTIATGTNDANSGTFDAGELASLESEKRQLVTGFRTDINEGSELPIFFFGPTWNGGLDPDREAIRAIYAAIQGDTDNIHIVDMAEFPASADNNHPDTSALRSFGPVVAGDIAASPEPQKLQPFALGSVTAADLDTDYESDPAMVRGIGIGETASLTVTGGETAVARVDDPDSFGAFSSAAKTVQWGDWIKVRRHSHPTDEGALTIATATLTGPVDSQQGTFTVTTAAAGTDFVTPVNWGGSDFVIANDNGLARFGGDGMIQGTY